MLSDGLQLLGASTATNFTIESGAALPTTGNTRGELFYQTNVGLHVHDGSDWVLVGSGGGGAVDSVNGQTGAVTLTTTNVAEGTNLYYTNARARAAISVSGSGSYDSGTGVISITGGGSSTVLNGTGTVTELQGGNAVPGVWAGVLTNQPYIAFYNSNASTARRYYDFYHDSANGTLHFRTGNDAISTFVDWLTLTRTGNAPGTLTLTAAALALVVGGSPGTNGQVLTSNGSTATWASSSSTSAANISGGAANQVPYQTGAGATAFSANFTFNGSSTLAVGATNATGIVTSNQALRITTPAESGTTSNAITIFPGGNGDGQGQTVTMSGGNGTDFGGALTINGGTATVNASFNTGGTVTIRGGQVSSPTTISTFGGNVTVIGGTAATGGNAYLQGGEGNNNAGGGNGGNVIIRGGRSAGGNNGGYVSFETYVTGSQTERFRLLQNGAWSVGSAGNNVGTAGQVLTSAGNAAPSWATPASDARLKTNVVQLNSSLERLKALRGVTFEFINPDRYGAGTQVGVIAQEVAAQFPEIVDENYDGFYGVRYDRLVAPLIEAVKELSAQNAALLVRIEVLENK